VVTLDINMPEMDGLTCLSRIMVEHPLPVVMISSLTADGARATLEAMALGAVDFLQKPGGTVSVAIHDASDLILEKVQAAARARLRRSTGLRQRIEASREQIIARGRAAHSVAPTADAMVLIGASTGGPGALEELLRGLPTDFPLPILICQHMPATITPHFAKRLDEVTALPVEEVRRTTVVQPGHVYLGRGDADMIVLPRGDGLAVTSVPSDANIPWHPSIGRLVHSAMRHVDPRRLIGVMLTGMGNDGAEEMTTLRRAGGRTIAESEQTAVIYGMPQALAARGGAETILPLDRIASRTFELAKRAARADV
jgi:two-component system chemotaxis response regulator CheB